MKKMQNETPNTKGCKKSVGTEEQIVNSSKMECVNSESKKTIYLRPNSEAKIDDFFKFQIQQFAHEHNVNMLESSIVMKYADVYGIQFARDLFLDACMFTNNFTSDIVSKLEDGIDGEDISYRKNDSDITRYLVNVDNANICSVFRHFMDYAIATSRSSVAPIIKDEEKRREENRLLNLNKRREEKKLNDTKVTLNSLDVEKLLAMLTPEQIAAIIAKKVA